MFLNNKIRWMQVPLLRSSQIGLPEAPGVYNFLQTRRIGNIPYDIVSFYIGKSLNIKRRFGQHIDPWRSHNTNLFNLINYSKVDDNLEFWFAELPKEAISKVEDYLIKNLKPKFNISNKGKKNDKSK